MKLCRCGRLATHAIALFNLDGEPNGKKQLACDAFPNCRPRRSVSEPTMEGKR